MNVVMVHSEHGAKVATQAAEIAEDEKRGWTRMEMPQPEQPAVKVTIKRTRKVVESVEDVKPAEEIPGFLSPVDETHKED